MRLRTKLKSKLNSKNKILEIRALAVPALRCTFGVFCWRFKGIKKSTGKTREVLTVYKIHHPKAYIGRQYVKKKGKEEEEVVEAACY
jgi:hypothetical protein